MARKLFRRKASRTRRYSGFFKRKRTASRSSGGLMPMLVAGALYGVGRETVVNMASPVTNMLPFGEYNDEALMATAGYFAHKGTFGKNKYIRAMGTFTMAAEAARIASGFSGGSMKSSGLYVN